MTTTTSSLEPNSDRKITVENPKKHDLLPTLGGVIPIAGFVVKLWFKVLKLSFRAAVWMIRKLPKPQTQPENHRPREVSKQIN